MNRNGAPEETENERGRDIGAKARVATYADLFIYNDRFYGALDSVVCRWQADRAWSRERLEVDRSRCTFADNHRGYLAFVHAALSPR